MALSMDRVNKLTKDFLKGQLTFQFMSKLLDVLVGCIYITYDFLVAIMEAWNCVLYP